MTKLMEWFAILGIFSSLWIAMITGILDFPFVLEWQQTILFLPLILLVLFGLYANFIIMYRVFTFNDCEDAAIELQQQIKEAKEDLKSKGIILSSS